MRIFFLLSTLLVATLLASPVARALDFPEIPDSKRVITQLEVKNYWVNMMPKPVEPRTLARDYKRLMVTYHQRVGERHRLIQEIRAGKHDDYAKIVMLRHNLQAYILRGNDAMVAQVAQELDLLEAVAEAEAKKNANDERLERLIAATERLAAAIENNGGVVPANAEQLVDEIVPFERADHDRRSVITYLYDEIALCRQPIVVGYPASTGQRHKHGHGGSTHSHPQRTGTKTPAHVHPPSSYPNGSRGSSSGRRNVVTPRTSLPRQPQVQPAPAARPQVRPAPAVRPQTPSRPIQVRQPQVRQPQVRPAR